MYEALLQYISDLMPPGPFWRNQAAERFKRALAAGLEDLADWVDGMRALLFPGSAPRVVLLAYWEWLKSDCSLPTPTDTEELRDQVLAALGASAGHTFAGLSARVASQLPTVELAELLDISNVPMDVPWDVNPHARVLEVWHVPAITPTSTVRCVVRELAQAADVLRLLAPSVELVGSGSTAEENAFRWDHAREATLVIERRDTAGGALLSSTVEVLAEPTDITKISTLLGIAGGTSLSGNEFTFYLLRDFGAGDQKITATQVEVIP